MCNSKNFTTVMEEKLSGYWREVLKVDAIHPDDHFINLGGHSLIAITVLNRVEEDFGIRLRMQDVFNTFQRFAAICEAGLAELEV